VRFDSVMNPASVSGDDRADPPAPGSSDRGVPVEIIACGGECGAPAADYRAAAQAARPGEALDRGPAFLRLALSAVPVDLSSPANHSTGHACSLAPRWVPLLLALEVARPYWPTAGRPRTSRLDPANERREQLVGCTTHSWRAAETGHRGSSI